MRSIIRSCLAFGLVAMTACATQPPVQNQLSPRAQAPLMLNVGKITVLEEYQSPMQAPNIEHLFSPPPAQGVRQWAANRLKASGGEKILEVTIKDASVVKADLPRTSGFKGIFTNDQAERYDGRVSVELRIYAPGELMSKANVTAEVTQSRTVAENASVQSRDAIFRALNTDLMTLLDQELERNIRQYFTGYLR